MGRLIPCWGGNRCVLQTCFSLDQCTYWVIGTHPAVPSAEGFSPFIPLSTSNQFTSSSHCPEHWSLVWGPFGDVRHCKALPDCRNSWMTLCLQSRLFELCSAGQAKSLIFQGTSLQLALTEGAPGFFWSFLLSWVFCFTGLFTFPFHILHVGQFPKPTSLSLWLISLYTESQVSLNQFVFSLCKGQFGSTIQQVILGHWQGSHPYLVWWKKVS